MMQLALPSPAATPPAAEPHAASHAGDPRKWLALCVLLLAQAMIILDIAIVNIALPSAQADLHISPTHVQWVVTAYLLPFGGLLLLGGRIADYTGRKRVFCVATAGFAIASAVGGSAGSESVLFAARAVQGTFAAAMAPALLSIMTLGFPHDPDRGRAFSAFGGVSAAGGAFGLVLGGLLTEYLSWRWSLLINVPMSGLVLLGAVPLLRESRVEAAPAYDVIGAALGTAGLLGLIYGIANVAQHGWGDQWTVLPATAGVATLVAFLAWEHEASDPLLPLSVLGDRTRGGAFLALAGTYGPGTGFVLLLLVFLQGPLHEGALSAGLRFLPIPAASLIAALVALRLVRILSARIIVAGASITSAAGFLAATRIGPHATFLGDMVPAFTLFGLGSATLFVVGNTVALDGVPDDDTALTSAVLNTVQQVGAALGVAILVSVATRSTTAYLTLHGPASGAQALAHGNDHALVLGAALMLATGLGAAWLLGGQTPGRESRA